MLWDNSQVVIGGKFDLIKTEMHVRYYFSCAFVVSPWRCLHILIEPGSSLCLTRITARVYIDCL
jgi:hypothetical protein